MLEHRKIRWIANDARQLVHAVENDGRARKAMTDELETAMTDEPEVERRPEGP